MKKDSRTFKSTKNAVYAIICQAITLILSFITRALFIDYLSSTYLGLNGVFSNIISFLCLAELGVGNVLLYNLYGPIRNKDHKKVFQVLNLFKKYYKIISIIILTLGLLAIPIIPFILTGVKFSIEILVIYLLFLCNTVCSYLYAYKMAILTADQKNYIVSGVTVFTTILKEGLQIIVLIIFKNYYLFLIITIVTTILKNILLNIQSNKILSNYKIKEVEEMDKESKKKIFSDFKDIFMYKVANVAIYSTDNILISSLLSRGTVLVGIYSNYLLITEALNKLISAAFQAFTGSIGNLNSGKNTEKKYDIFNSLSFMAYWIYGVCCTCLLLLINPFINLFAGSEYIFSTIIVIIIIVAFYIDGTFIPVWIFRETAGIFKKSKRGVIILAITNIILSIILGKIFGIAGILGATVISRLFTTYWYEPYLIFSKYLNKSFKEYIFNNIKFLIKNLIVILITYSIFDNIVIASYFDFIIYGILIFVTANILLLILNFREFEFKFLVDKIKFLFRRKV